MKTVRTISFLAAITGVYYLTISVLGVIVLRNLGFRYFAKSLPILFIAFFLLGILSVFLSYGLWFQKPWSQRGWLAFSAFCFLFHLAVIIWGLSLGGTVRDPVEEGFILGFYFISCVLIARIGSMRKDPLAAHA